MPSVKVVFAVLLLVLLCVGFYEFVVGYTQKLETSSLRFVFVVETMDHTHVPRFHFIANLAIALQRLGHKVRILPIESCVDQQLAERLARNGVELLACPCQHSPPSTIVSEQEVMCCGQCGLGRVECVQQTDDLFRGENREYLPRLAPGGVDVVVLGHAGGMERTLPAHLSWYLIRRVRLWPTPPKVVFLADDVLSIRLQMFEMQARDPTGAPKRAWSTQDCLRFATGPDRSSSHVLMQKIELALLRHSNGIWLISEQDQVLLEGTMQNAPNFARLPFVPWAQDSPASSTTFVPLAKRSDLLFCGWGWTESSVFGLRFLVHHVMPILLKELPHVKLRIVGHDWDKEEHRLQGLAATDHELAKILPNIEWVGTLSTEGLAAEISHSRLFLSPVISQTGVVSKLWKPMALGLPVVTTDAGLVGLRDCKTDIHQAVLSANTPKEFATAVARLYKNDNEWLALSRAARRMIQTCFTVEQMQFHAHEAVKKLISIPTLPLTLPASVEGLAISDSSVYACSDSDYRGVCAEITATVDTISVEGMSSIAVGNAAIVVLYSEPFRQGECLVVRQSLKFLASWNDRPKSLRIISKNHPLTFGEGVFLETCKGMHHDDFSATSNPNTCRSYSH